MKDGGEKAMIIEVRALIFTRILKCYDSKQT